MNKKYVFIFALLFLICLIGITNKVMAHPPNDITFEFDKETKVLKLKVAHSVKDGEKHYVDEIKIFIDNTLVLNQIFKKQFNNDFQEAVYLLTDASEGTTIKIEAQCNRFGTLKRNITLK